MGNQVPEKKYLAVLPIENISENPELQAICNGLAEMFSYKLSELEQYQDSYWVTPASEMRRERVASVTQANELFGVNLAISSSIQTLQDSTRLILELVDADNIRRLDTEQVMVSSENLTALEREGVKAVLRMLQIEINPQMDKSLTEGKTVNGEAYELYLKGLSALQGNGNGVNLEQAITFFTEAANIDSEFALVYARLGEAYWRMYETTGNVELVTKAEKVLQKALDIDAQLAPVQTLLGILKSGTGEQEEAITHFSQAIEIDPTYNSAYSGMARAFEQQGNSDKAISTYLRAVNLKPDYWAGYKDLGVYYLNKGDIPEAITQFQKVVELTPKNGTAYSNLGVAYYYNGQYVQARQMFERSLALDKDPLTANNLAGIYYWEGSYREAADMYEIALAGYSDRYEIWGNLAAAYELSGQHQEARKTYFMAIEKALAQLEVNAEAPDVVADLGAYYSDIGDTTQALTYIERALTLNSDNLRVRQRAVSTYEKLGMREQALGWIDVTMLSDIESQPELSNLVEDPRYLDRKEELALPEK
ncbi:MAG: tetratricopeptide repeat protein [Balneolaceae bacterium]|nr:tetratricopeptide repeat protein [Balneolaceae bacterium]